MLDAFKNLGAVAGLVKDMPRIKAKMEEVRRKAESTRVAATSGGGAVTAVASGRLRIESLSIEPALFAGLAASDDPANRALATELVREATNTALEKAQLMMAEMLAEAARELNLPISAEQLQGLL